MLILLTANGEQDQGVSFKGPNPSEETETAADPTLELESEQIPKSPMASELRRDSFKNIGQRRRSSASNQLSVNLRKGISLSVEFVLMLFSTRIF